jgi:hypothetical protein
MALDERKPPCSPDDKRQMVGSVDATPATGAPGCAHREGQQSPADPREASTVVFCGDAEQVSAAFVLALKVMQAHADFLATGIEPGPEEDLTPPDS